MDPTTYLRILRHKKGTVNALAPSDPKERNRLLQIANERVKLTASFINSISLAFVVLGVVRPYLDNQGVPNSTFAVTAPFLVGLVLHMLARAQLSKLNVER